MLEITNRNLALDSLRGVAAMGILIWHYQHFFSLSGSFTQPYIEKIPFLYNFGWIMVDLFFCLSGYIFFSYYQKKISESRISLKDFIILRLSRLYPLIIVSLIVTAILNYMLFFLKGKFYIYESNNLFAFFANLLFLQSGFFNIGSTFNGPSWSLGVEFWIYLIFFGIAFHFKKNLALISIFISLFFLSAFNQEKNLGFVIFTSEFERGLGSFFLGGVTHYIVQFINNSKRLNGNLIGIIAIAVVIIGYTLIHKKFSIGHEAFIEALLPNTPTIALTLILILHPLLIISVTISPFLNKLFSIKFLRFFGDISYSSYLWHVPIQLGIFLVVFICDLHLNPASKFFFFTYLLTIILISFLSAKYFEKPIQKKIRDFFFK
jgi:peptidoglycan/LPS O-acetylase OafA/YrhL